MNRLPSLLTLLFVVCISMASCNKQDNPKTGMSYTVETAAASFNFVFSPEADWTATPSASWVSASPAFGNAGENITWRYLWKNTSYDDRTATITIMAGDKTNTYR